MAGPLQQHDQHTFLVLPENQLAVSAVKKLRPGQRQRTTALVSVIGPSGAGKSRLSRDLIRSWNKQKNHKKLITVTASEFAAQFAEASSKGSIRQFQTRYRKGIQLFVCEDIQMLGSRIQTQTQLIATIDAIIADDGVVLLSSTKMPGEIKGLSKRLVNRIHGGLCVSMDLPDVASRTLLIQHFLTTDSLQLKEDQIGLIAESNVGSARDLLGLLTQLRAHTKVLKDDEGTSLKKVLQQLQGRSPITLHEIARQTAKVFGVSIAGLKSPRRSQTVSLARQTAMYLARELSDKNYKEIGAYFNRRNHSTVIHGCQKIEAAVQEQPGLARNVSEIRKTLQAGLV